MADNKEDFPPISDLLMSPDDLSDILFELTGQRFIKPRIVGIRSEVQPSPNLKIEPVTFVKLKDQED